MALVDYYFSAAAAMELLQRDTIHLHLDTEPHPPHMTHLQILMELANTDR